MDPARLQRRVELALTSALSAERLAGSPPRLAAAARHGVFPGGGRVRPLLTVAVSAACGDDDPALADAGAAAVELIHCASLIHDDLPCFDDAATRRGRPSVHAAFGEQLGVLSGDALITHAFDVIAEHGERHPLRALRMTRALAAGVGMPDGIIGGQAWEAEPRVDRRRYHHAKTASLFQAALELGALAAGGQAAAWRPLGAHIGAAYQLADDLHDVLGAAADEGKPVGQDLRLGRPNAVVELGLEGALDAFHAEVRAAVQAVPDCEGRALIVGLVRATAARLLPAPQAAEQQALAL